MTYSKVSRKTPLPNKGRRKRSSALHECLCTRDPHLARKMHIPRGNYVLFNLGAAQKSRYVTGSRASFRDIGFVTKPFCLRQACPRQASATSLCDKPLRQAPSWNCILRLRRHLAEAFVRVQDGAQKVYARSQDRCNGGRMVVLGPYV